MTTMKRVRNSTAPKDFWKFFRELGDKSAAFLLPGKLGLTAQETEDLDDPPGELVLDAKVRRADWIVFLQCLVALRGGRPVKVIPADNDEYRVLVGPKAS